MGNYHDEATRTVGNCGTVLQRFLRTENVTIQYKMWGKIRKKLHSEPYKKEKIHRGMF